MITLALQIFLLLLSAFLVGCMVGCLLRRALYTARRVPATAVRPVSVAPPVAPRHPATSEAARFEKALTGTEAVPGPAASREPVVEVRRPAPPVAAPVPAPAPAKPTPADIEIVKAEPAAPAPAATFVPAAPPPPPPSAAEAPAPSAPPSAGDATTAASYAAVAAASAAAVGAGLAAPAAPEAEPEPEPEPETTETTAPPASVPDAPGPIAAETAALVVDVEQPAPPPPVTAGVEPAPAPLPADDLKRIRGIDRTVEGRLNGFGVRRFDDIAVWSSDDVARMNQSLGFLGRIEQENWIEQAQILARGGDTDYSRRQQIAQSTAAAGLAAAAAGAAASATAQTSAGPDRFTRIIGVDPDTERVLHAMGVTRYAQIAQWTSSDIERVERELNRPGRVGLDNWVEQARVLARYAGEPAAVPAAAATGERPEPAAATALPAAPPAPPPAPPPAAPRPDLAGLRSVRSQALRGDAGSHGERIDDLKRIRGIGVLIEKRLNGLGIVSYEQIANWTGTDIDRVSSTLDFKGRIERENWIEQARILASGGQTEFSRRVDRGEVDSSRES